MADCYIQSALNERHEEESPTNLRCSVYEGKHKAFSPQLYETSPFSPVEATLTESADSCLEPD